MTIPTTTNSLIVVCGPTGSGKTGLGVRMAVKLGAPVLSADSRQLYRGMAIGTAQPDVTELAAAPHYLVANHDVTEHYAAGDYEREALGVLDELFRTHDTVIAVGGSGLYIDALCDGLDELPEADEALRNELQRRWEEDREGVLAELRELDPEYYARVDRANPRRVIRALEVCRASGQPFSALRRNAKRERPFQMLKIGLSWPREELYARIDRRVDAMMEAGLEAEARALYPERHLSALQTVGYRELFDHFDGRTTLAEAVELIKRNSRRYAKRQITWFSRDEAVRWFAPDDTAGIDRCVAEFLGR